MKVLVVGSGGREHALCWKLAQSPRVRGHFCAPGNAGIEEVARLVPIAADDIKGLVRFATEEGIDLTVVGPEAPLALGIQGAFRAAGLRIFAPSKEASQLESSKVFAKDFCARYGIPAARSAAFTDATRALDYARGQGLPLVVKADGLAAGKGVVICKSFAEAAEAVEGMMVRESLGAAGRRVLIEEFLPGEEASFIAICDGKTVLPLASSQDHKAVFDGDAGPNTGGMGAVSPARVVTPQVEELVMKLIMRPAVAGMLEEGMPFTGTLYAGLMVRDGFPRVLEFNVRMGDPETQPLLVRLETDLLEVLLAACEGRLHRVALSWDERPACCVVMASGGYPKSFEKGKKISGLAEAARLKDVVVFHAGTKRVPGAIVTDGGRVLGVTALGSDMRAAIARAYEAAGKISWDGVHYRKDIGAKALRS